MMLSIDNLLEYANQWVRELEYNDEPKSLYAPITYSLGLGGKRLRPVLCLASCALFLDDYARARQAAMAIEVFHNFTLLHDDVMDNASMRRGQPTVCAKWNDNVAILSGDEMLVQSFKMMNEVDSPMATLVMDTFIKTASEVCRGQQYDMDFERQKEVSIDDYMEMIRLKTAVLIAASIKIGALIGGATLQETNALYDFGIKVGLAFQLQDDLLDVYGDEKSFGKNIGGDIMENKKTYLLLLAIRDANATQKRELATLFEKEDCQWEEKVAAVTDIYNQLNVKEKTEAQINEFMDEATNTLRSMEISAEGKRVMLDFVKSLISRNK